MNRSSYLCTSVAGTFVLATMAFGGGVSTCCVANDTPGCDDTTCQEIVCAVDAFCCDTEWDLICANTAADLCAPLCDGVGPDCPSATNDCFTASGLPGCSDAECCSIVCALDPFCCDVAWDGLCVSGALANCDPPTGQIDCPEGAIIEGEACGDDTNGGCNAPVVGDSNCCAPNPDALPGCDDPICEAAVCAVDPFCCDVQWDGLCSGAALDLCSDICSLGAGAFEPIECGDTICGTGWAVGGTRDTDWYELVLERPTLITFSITAAFSSVIGVVDTGGIPDCSLATALNPFATAGPFGSTSFTVCLPEGTHWLFVAPNAFEGFPCGTNNDYVISLTCADGNCVPPACGDPNSGDCFIANGTPFCDDEECCLLVCALDPFCCDIAWDGLCATAASNSCVSCEIDCAAGSVIEDEACGDDTNGGCNAPVVGDSNCCAPNPDALPGCDDPICEAAVCAVDPFCCDVQWDGLCSGAALDLCSDICSLGAGAFEPIECGDTICGTGWAVGGTRDTDWYELVIDGPGNKTVTVNATANFPFVIGVVATGGVPDCSLATALNPFATGVTCGSAQYVAVLGPGTHWLFIAPNAFDGFPCGTANDYVMTVTCEQGGDVPACGVAGTGSCFVANGTPFCDDEECCLLVCSLDPFCCDVAWDGLCATTALTNCGAEPIANDNCEDRIPLLDGLTAFSTIGATTDGPALPAECEEGFGLSFVNDIWFNYTATCDGVVTISTCNSADYDTRLAVYTGDCDNLSFLACNDDGAGCAGFTSILVFNGECDVVYKVRVGGFGGSGTGTLSVTCDGEPCDTDPCGPCPADLNGDGFVDGADLGLLGLAWGACPGCCADLNGDGFVDGADLGLLGLAWGACD